MDTYKISVVTSLFNNGSDANTPEIRVTSIRGVLRRWYRYLYNEGEENIFGGINGKMSKASKVVFRVCPLLDIQTRASIHQSHICNALLLPHDPRYDNIRYKKNAFKADYAFELKVKKRLEGLHEENREKLEKTIQAWLLMGSLGLRTTRGAGSLLWDQQPMDESSYIQACQKLFPSDHPRLRWALLNESFGTLESARKVASDTLDSEAFSLCQYALGNSQSKKPKKPKQPRRTSSLKFKVVKLKDAYGDSFIYKILALFDLSNQHRITLSHLKQAIDILENHPKDIGRLLKNSTLYTNH